jgi:hypothetical protein
MSVLTDFVIANENEAQAVAQSLNAAEQWPTLESRGIEPIKLAKLYCCISGANNAEEVVDGFSLLHTEDPKEGPWVMRIPANVLATFADFDDAALPRFSRLWAATEELRAENWTEEDAEQFIEEIQRHALKARGRKSSMLLRIGL